MAKSAIQLTSSIIVGLMTRRWHLKVPMQENSIQKPVPFSPLVQQPTETRRYNWRVSQQWGQLDPKASKGYPERQWLRLDERLC